LVKADNCRVENAAVLCGIFVKCVAASLLKLPDVESPAVWCNTFGYVSHYKPSYSQFCVQNISQSINQSIRFYFRQKRP